MASMEEKMEAEGLVEELTADEARKGSTDETAASHAAESSQDSEVPVDNAGEGIAERNKRVYVGNLAWEASDQDLTGHFKASGLDVKTASVLKTPDGRSKGCGIVELASSSDAERAVEILNDTDLKGRQIFVREDREDRRIVSGSTSGFIGSGRNFSFEERAKNRRVYVGNLSWDVAWQDLKDHMRAAGEVLHAEVIKEHTGRSKGCGIVEYASEQDAQKAISTLTDTDLKGRLIFVREDREKAASQATNGPSIIKRHNTSVYVWNLTVDTSWQDLKDHMRKAGNVDSATILTNSQGESVGCAIVIYQRPQEAARAIRELQNSELRGQPIFVREDRAQGGRGRFTSFSGGRGGRSGRGGRGAHHQRGSDDHDSQVFVGNLAQETTWRELKDHFRQCGEVGHVEIKSSYHGQSRGFGFVQFSTKEEAETAVARLNGSELQGCRLDVRLHRNR